MIEMVKNKKSKFFISGICLFFFWVLLLLFGTDFPFAIAARAEESSEKDVFEYQLQDDGSVKITSCTFAGKELEIPKEIDDCPVTVLGEYAFSSMSDLQSVVIPESIKSIEKDAF